MEDTQEVHTVGIVGLGLIGGSFAKAYHAAGWRVLAFDIDADTMAVASIDETIQGTLGPDNVGECDLILLALYPAGCIAWLKENAERVRKDCLVIDTAGVKREVCAGCMPIAAEHGFTFVGGHPMAGTQYSGYKYTRENLFHNAPMVICPPRVDDMALFERIKDLLAPAGFGSICVSTPEEHDKRIAFTSQLAHVVSNAFIKSPTAQGHKGFSAGSYKDSRALHGSTRTCGRSCSSTMPTICFLSSTPSLRALGNTAMHSLRATPTRCVACLPMAVVPRRTPSVAAKTKGAGNDAAI